MLAGAAASSFCVWLVGRDAARRIETDDIEISSRRQPPLPDFPTASRTADNNNRIVRIGLVADPDGTAIAYNGDADGLFSDGKFRTGLSLEQAAKVLRVSPDTLSNPMSPGEIDPNVELFKVQVGTLTPSARQLTRKIRKQQVLQGKKPDAIVADWVITKFSFTLNRLKQPTMRRRSFLRPSCAAAETMPARRQDPRGGCEQRRSRIRPHRPHAGDAPH